jgi:hypothetical protein
MSKNKGVTIIEHTKPEQKEYFIEERKYANGETKYLAVFNYVNEPSLTRMMLGIQEFEKKSDAIAEIERDIARTPIEVITYQYELCETKKDQN